MSLVKTTEKENNKKELEVSVDAKVFEEACEKAYKKSVKRINVPGFRKGKAPRKIVEKMYGSEIFYNDAAEEVYPKALDEAIKEAKLDVVAVESIDTVEINKETGFVFKALCVLKPEVELKKYKGLKANKNEIKISSKDVDSRIEDLKERGARLISIEDRAAKMGDIVKLDFDGYVDGKQFKGGKAENYNLTLGSKQFIKGFEEQIEGKKKGEEFDVVVTFPKDYGVKELENKEAVFKCKLNDIQEKEYPKLDDEFAKDVSEFETLKELKDNIKKELKEQAQKNEDALIEDQIVSELIENLKADIPRIMIDKRVDALISQMRQRLSLQGLRVEDYQKLMGKNEEEFKKQFEEQAQRQVKCRLALEKVASLENIELTKDEIEEEYKKLAKDYKMELDNIKKYITEDEIKSDLKVEKALKLVKDEAKIEVKTQEKKDTKNTTTAKKTASKTTKKDTVKK